MRSGGEFGVILPLVNAESGVDGDLIGVVVMDYIENLIKLFS